MSRDRGQVVLSISRSCTASTPRFWIVYGPDPVLAFLRGAVIAWAPGRYKLGTGQSGLDG